MTDYATIIDAAITASGLDRYLVTRKPDGSIALPGLEMAPSDYPGEGWTYREARGYDAETGTWDGEESGDLDDIDDGIDAAVRRAAARVAEPAITDEQIAALCREAAAHGDDEMVEVCDRALDGDDAARAECAEAIAAAAASGRLIYDTAHLAPYGSADGAFRVSPPLEDSMNQDIHENDEPVEIVWVDGNVILALQRAAKAAGHDRMVRTCDRAMMGDEDAIDDCEEALRSGAYADAGRAPLMPRVSTKYDWDTAASMYERRCTDMEIARELGCSQATVIRWRRSNDLPVRSRQKGTPPTHTLHTAIATALGIEPHRGRKACAEALGVPVPTYTRWVSGGGPTGLGHLVAAAQRAGVTVWIEVGVRGQRMRWELPTGEGGEHE